MCGGSHVRKGLSELVTYISNQIKGGSFIIITKTSHVRNTPFDRTYRSKVHVRGRTHVSTVVHLGFLVDRLRSVGSLNTPFSYKKIPSSFYIQVTFLDFVTPWK